MTVATQALYGDRTVAIRHRLLNTDNFPSLKIQDTACLYPAAIKRTFTQHVRIVFCDPATVAIHRGLITGLRLPHAATSSSQGTKALGVGHLNQCCHGREQCLTLGVELCLYPSESTSPAISGAHIAHAMSRSGPRVTKPFDATCNLLRWWLGLLQCGIQGRIRR